jgi:protein-disulfide isomerase-like protein with CxxC motif
MLHARHLARMPAVQKIAQDSAVAAQLAVIVGRAFPDAQRGEVRRFQRAHVPLVHRVIGNAVDADLAVAPGLRAGPLDAFVKVLRLARRPHVERARRTPGTARVDAHQSKSVRDPFLWID